MAGRLDGVPEHGSGAVRDVGDVHHEALLLAVVRSRSQLDDGVERDAQAGAQLARLAGEVSVDQPQDRLRARAAPSVPRLLPICWYEYAISC